MISRHRRPTRPTAVDPGATLPAASASRPVPPADECGANGRGAGLSVTYLFGGREGKRPYSAVSDNERDMWEPLRSIRG